jgi:hypothetical protein
MAKVKDFTELMLAGVEATVTMRPQLVSSLDVKSHHPP